MRRAASMSVVRRSVAGTVALAIGGFALAVTPAASASTTNYVKGRTTNGFTLYPRYNGVKVYLVQKALGVPTSSMTTKMGPNTIAAVTKFQHAHGLPATGNVDAQTYYAIKDLTRSPFMVGHDFDVDALVQPSRISSRAPRPERVNTMIAFAEAQLGVTYVWGGTGPMGYDCSGLLLQALRAGGMAPARVSNATDVMPASDLSGAMWRDPEFRRGDLGHLAPGDFIYYGAGKTVKHVALYIGGGQVISAATTRSHPWRVQTSPVSENFGWSKIGVNRMP